MENRKPLRRPGSGRPSSRFNPITGEEYCTDVKSQNIEANSNNNNNNKYSVRVPALDLGSLKDDDKRVPEMTNMFLDLHSPSSDVSWRSPASTDRGSIKGKEVDMQAVEKEMQNDELLGGWMADSYTDHTKEKMADANLLEEKKKHEKVLETMMIDQLSRAVICDPSQESERNGTSTNLFHQPGQPRGAIRRLHQSKVKTSATPTEHLLAQRVRFTARILTRNGADAVRELTGFFFFADNSMTVYEYKQIGKLAKALPFIMRGTYSHLFGRRKGMPFTLADIVLGNTLHFNVEQQKMVSDASSARPVVFLRICDVDDKAKSEIVLSTVRPSDHARVWNEFHALNPAERKDKETLSNVQAKLQAMIKNRGIKTYTGLMSHFKSSDRTGDGFLDKYELQDSLNQFRINLDSADFESVWSILDVNGDGVLDYGEFLRGFLGCMNEYRKLFVRKAFQKVDPMHEGVVSLSVMSKFFNAAKHPSVQCGQVSEVGLREQFLSSWSHCASPGHVTYPEFEDYCEGLSFSIQKDEEFINILRNCWGI